MQIFRVEFKETRQHVVLVEADNEQEAVELAACGDYQPVTDQFDDFDLMSVEVQK